jgi:hypothetical protein
MLLHTRHQGQGPRQLHGKLSGRVVAPRVHTDWLVKVNLRIMQTDTNVHQLQNTYPTVTKDSKKIQSTTKVLLT